MHGWLQHLSPCNSRHKSLSFMLLKPYAALTMSRCKVLSPGTSLPWRQAGWSASVPKGRRLSHTAAAAAAAAAYKPPTGQQTGLNRPRGSTQVLAPTSRESDTPSVSDDPLNRSTETDVGSNNDFGERQASHAEASSSGITIPPKNLYTHLCSWCAY